MNPPVGGVEVCPLQHYERLSSTRCTAYGRFKFPQLNPAALHKESLHVSAVIEITCQAVDAGEAVIKFPLKPTSSLRGQSGLPITSYLGGALLHVCAAALWVGFNRKSWQQGRRPLQVPSRRKVMTKTQTCLASTLNGNSTPHIDNSTHCTLQNQEWST